MASTFIINTSNIKEVLLKAEDSIIKAGGKVKNNKFEISTSVGFFSGSYEVKDSISITINKKPMLVPMSVVEKYVRNFFNG